MSYRDVASKQVVIWACTSVGARMPVAMAPLAVVFLVRERPGGYALGAVLAAAYVLGEIVGAPVLGMRLRPERARPQLATGLAAGCAGFVGLGALPGAHPVVLAAFAFLAGGAPAASAGGLRAMLTDLVPERAVAQAMSTESILVSVIWAVSPAAVTGLALGVAPRVPPLLAAALMASAVAGLWLLPVGWKTGDTDGGGDTGDADGRGGAGGQGRAGESPLRVLIRAWPVFVTGAAGLALLGLAELVLPALLEQRGIRVGWSGPLLTGLAVGGGLGAFLYGLRDWPGLPRNRGAVLICGMSACMTLVALIPSATGIAGALAVGGMLQAGGLLNRNLALREALPPGILAAGYSVMYAAAGVGYAATGSLAGALLPVTTPSNAILAGVALTLVLGAIGWWGEKRSGERPTAPGADTADIAVMVVSAGGAAPAGPVDQVDRGSAGSAGSTGPLGSARDPGADPCRLAASGHLDAPGPEGTAIRGRRDPEHRL
ncbi:hypothetical protein [Streptomyces graminilatus]|uniref:hypothetical protein n=1 Tax=Streptomyces graminilatus TaxID=1464070 RepID=UPI0006E2B314|nr:hypothetical protein [Streptomyces graminilatus]